MLKLDEHQQAQEKSYLQTRFPRLPEEVIELLSIYGTWNFLKRLGEMRLIDGAKCVDEMYSLGRSGNLIAEWQLASILAAVVQKRVEQVFPEDKFIYPSPRREIKSAARKAARNLIAEGIEVRKIKPRAPRSQDGKNLDFLGLIGALIVENENDLSRVVKLLPRNLSISPEQLRAIVGGDIQIVRGGLYTLETRAAHYLVNYCREKNKLKPISIDEMSTAISAGTKAGMHASL